MSALKRVLKKVFDDISSVADRINLPETIVNKAKILFKQAHECKRVNGRSNKSIAVACLYITCRQWGLDRTFKELGSISGLGVKTIGRCYNIIKKELGVPITTSDFVSCFCSNLGLPNAAATATHIAAKAAEMEIFQKCPPMLVAVTAVYMASEASENKKSYTDVAKITGVSESAITKLHEVMYGYGKVLFPMA